MVEQLNKNDSTEIENDTRKGPHLKKDYVTKIDSWTLITKTHAPGLFRLYEGKPESEWDYYFVIKDSGMTTATRFYGLTTADYQNIKESFEVNPAFV